jgi:DNA-binding CsgD family transcriptional regulator/uncharacterized protein YhfF
MQSARTEAFWQAFRRHEGISQAHCMETWFHTPPDVTDRLLARMAAGAMRADFGPMHFYADRHEKPLPAAGDYTVLVDRQRRPRLIWRTTGVAVGPLSAVTQELVWRSGVGDGERKDWLRRVGAVLRCMSKLHGFETHADIEMMFETLEVVWPLNVARRIRLVTPHLDRGIALLQRLDEQRRLAAGVEAILARIQTAVLTVGPTLRVGFTNPTAEALLRVGDGLRLKNGHLATRWPADESALAAAVSVACNRTDQTAQASDSAPPSPRAGDLIRIFRDDIQPPYRVSIFPLKPGHAVCGLASASQAVLFVDDPDQDAVPAPAGLFSRAFQLTPAEARLAVHLTSGSSLSDAADVLHVTYNTVRAQLRAIFDKTATHRQTELVRLLQTCQSLRVSLS